MTQGIVSAPAPAQMPSPADQAPGSAMPTDGQWGQYKDHAGTQYRRVSTLIKKVETDTYNLDLWRQRQVAEGMALRDDLVLSIKAMGRPGPFGWTKEQKSLINGVVKTASEAAKSRDGAKVGTAMHTLTERVDRGEPIEQVAAGLPAEIGTTIRAYAALRELNGWQVVEIERTVVCDELECAGTFDRIELVPGLAAMLGPGPCQYGDDCPDAGLHSELPVIVDEKTEEAPWLNGLHIGPQLAIYSRALRMWLPGDSQTPAGYVPAPCVRQDVAIVVHLREGRARPYFLNLDEGWDAARAAYVQLQRESRAKRKLGAQGCWFAPVPGIVEPMPAQTLVEHAAAERYADPARPYAVGDTVTVAGIDFTKHAELGEQVAVKDPTTGLVSWQTTTAEAARQFDEHDELRIKLIEQIWRTESLGGLGVLWNMAQDRGVPWRGPVQQAGDARRRQIECGQRQLHAGSGKCACGWMPPLPA